MSLDLLDYLNPARFAELSREVDLRSEASAELRSGIAARKAQLQQDEAREQTFGEKWRERSAARRAAEPPHTEVNALWFSLEALDEAFEEHRPFSWACTEQEKHAALDRCIAKSVGRLV